MKTEEKEKEKIIDDQEMYQNAMLILVGQLFGRHGDEIVKGSHTILADGKPTKEGEEKLGELTNFEIWCFNLLRVIQEFGRKNQATLTVSEDHYMQRAYKALRDLIWVWVEGHRKEKCYNFEHIGVRSENQKYIVIGFESREKSVNLGEILTRLLKRPEED